METCSRNGKLAGCSSPQCQRTVGVNGTSYSLRWHCFPSCSQTFARRPPSLTAHVHLLSAHGRSLNRQKVPAACLIGLVSEGTQTRAVSWIRCTLLSPQRGVEGLVVTEGGFHAGFCAVFTSWCKSDLKWTKTLKLKVCSGVLAQRQDGKTLAMSSEN